MPTLQNHKALVTKLFVNSWASASLVLRTEEPNMRPGKNADDPRITKDGSPKRRGHGNPPLQMRRLRLDGMYLQLKLQEVAESE